MKKLKFSVEHSKRLAPSQFDSIKGSSQHAAMTLNRVWLKAAEIKNFEQIDYIKKRWTEVDNWLLQNCRNYYFIADKHKPEEYRIYFLSRRDMEEFIVWSKLKLP